METQKFPYDDLPPISTTYGVTGVILSALGFQILNAIVVKVGLPDSVDAKDTWKYNNLVISWIHALIIGIWDITCFIIYPELTTDLIAYNNYYLHGMVVVSTGYFLYDFMDMIRNNKLFKMWEVSMHHVAVAGVFSYNIVMSTCLAYTVVALLAEVNSIFLHTRKLMQMRKWSFDHWAYKLNIWVNLITFLPCRFFAVAWINYGMVLYHYRISTPYWYTLATAVFVMWGINFFLFARLVKSDVFRSTSGDLFRSAKGSSGKKGSPENGRHHSINSNNNEKQINGTKHKLN